jgi:hypothetical protein
VSIDLGFALSEPVEIRAVDDGDLFHGGGRSSQEQAEEVEERKEPFSSGARAGN